VKFIVSKLAPPRFEDPETSRQAELLNGVSLVLIVILGALFFLNLLHDLGLGLAVNPVLAVLVVAQVFAQLLIRRGYVRVAGLSLLVLSWVGITWFASVADGVRDVVLFAYVTIVLGAGYMFGWRVVLLFTVSSILSIWLLAFYEISGLTHPTLSDPTRVAIYLTALLLLVSFQVYYVINTFKKALEGVTYEVAVRKQMEAALRTEQEKLSFALDAANMGTWSWDIAAGTVEWSDTIEAMFGMEKGTFDGQYSTYVSVVHPDERQMLQEQIQRALDDKDFRFTVEHRIVLPGGGLRWLEGRGNVYRDDAGHPIRMAGTVVDITDRKRSEEALRLAEENYRNIVKNSAHGIFQSTPEGKFLNVNPAMARIYGYDSPENYIKSIETISGQVYVDPADREQFARTLMNDGAIHGFEARNRRRDGSIIWISCNAHTVKDSNGTPLYYEGTVEDITERKESYAERERLLSELSAKNAELERFVYTVSHDLKSPLVTIVGFLGYVEEDVKTGDVDAMHRDMDRIYRATFKMQELLQDLLDLSRVGRMMNEPQLVPFDTLVNEAVELTQGRLRERGIQVNIQPDLPVVYGDAKRLLELVQNLIDNAAKYMGDQTEPRIEIGCSGIENGKQVFYVHDNGMGIAPEHHERIFGLFNKLDSQVEGTGVGLALVKRIVEFHGGRIWVESEAGQGATFRFSLPTGEQAVSPKSK
jgi:PAS domain S-box-containing protein